MNSNKILEEFKETLKIKTPFSVLPEAVLKTITDDILVVKYNKGDNIVKQGEFVTHGLYLYNGFVKLYQNYNDEAIILDILDNQRFITLPYNTVSYQHTFSINALNDVNVCYVDITKIRDCANGYGEFAVELLKQALKIAEITNKKIYYIAANNIHTRIANTILYLHDYVFKTKKFNILISREEFSQYTGISRGNVIKVLSEFDNEGILNVRGKEMEIIDIEKLKQAARK